MWGKWSVKFQVAPAQATLHLTVTVARYANDTAGSGSITLWPVFGQSGDYAWPDNLTDAQWDLWQHPSVSICCCSQYNESNATKCLVSNEYYRHVSALYKYRRLPTSYCCYAA